MTDATARSTQGLYQGYWLLTIMSIAMSLISVLLSLGVGYPYTPNAIGLAIVFAVASIPVAVKESQRRRARG